MPPTLHQLLASATPHDAVTGQARAWQASLARRGIHGEIYAENVTKDLARHVRGLRQFSPKATDGVVLHYSIWSDVLARALAVPRDRLGVYYHNVTPATFLEQVNPMVAALCARGRRELPRLGRGFSVAMAASQFNADELHQEGFNTVAVVPLLLAPHTPPPARESVAPIVVTVGRLVPNKRLEDAIRTIALLRSSSQPDAELVIVGSSAGFELYEEALRRFAHAIGVDDAVRFTGNVSDDERDVLYAQAGAYLCMSEHEGFCAPLIEALGHGLPVVAGDAAAIPETLGGAGLVIPDRDPMVAAEALNAVLTDFPLRVELARRGVERLAELAPARVEQMIADAVRPLLAT